MRCQFVLDERTNRLLEELAADRAGNRSHVVREAIQLYADMEARLGEIEADPRFQRMMAESEKAIREGRLYTQEEVERELRRARRRRKKK